MAPATGHRSSARRNRSSISMADIIAETIDMADDSDSDSESGDEPPQKRRRTQAQALPSATQTQASTSSGSSRVDSSEFRPSGLSSFTSSDVEERTRTTANTDPGEVDALKAQLAATRDELATMKQTFTRDLASIEENISCEVCMQKLWYPYLIPRCGHAFCENCLLAWFRQNRPDFTCPSCRVAVRHMPAEIYFVKQLVQNLSTAQGKLTGRADQPPERTAGAKAELEALFPAEQPRGGGRRYRDHPLPLRGLLHLYDPMPIDDYYPDGVPLPPMAPPPPPAPILPPHQPPERERRHRRSYVPEVVITARPPRLRERERDRQHQREFIPFPFRQREPVSPDILPWVAENRRQIREDPLEFDVPDRGVMGRPRHERGRDELARHPNASSLLNDVPLQLLRGNEPVHDELAFVNDNPYSRRRNSNRGRQQGDRETNSQPAPTRRRSPHGDDLLHFLRPRPETHTQPGPSNRRSTRDDLSGPRSEAHAGPGPSNRNLRVDDGPLRPSATIEVIDVDRAAHEERHTNTEAERSRLDHRRAVAHSRRRHRQACADIPFIEQPRYPIPGELERDLREVELDIRPRRQGPLGALTAEPYLIEREDLGPELNAWGGDFFNRNWRRT